MNKLGTEAIEKYDQGRACEHAEGEKARVRVQCYVYGAILGER